MKTIVTWLALIAWLLPAAVFANPQPAKGMLLVATEVVQGEVFGKTVILLLHYDDNGAMGLVVNRPTEIEPGELVDDPGAFSDYGGTLYWGGPVQMNTLRALVRTDAPPEGGEAIVGSVYLVKIDDELQEAPRDPANLRYFIGYAGWGAGQLDREMARGSWHIVPATDKSVFAEDPRALWKQLTPPREHRAATRPNNAPFL